MTFISVSLRSQRYAVFAFVSFLVQELRRVEDPRDLYPCDEHAHACANC